MNLYSCNDKEQEHTTTIVQAGWVDQWVNSREGTIFSRIPKMVTIPVKFNTAVKCGHLGRATDNECNGCKWKDWIQP